MTSDGVEFDLLRAVRFAADRHRDQRRKDEESSPYINHPIAVAETLSRAGVRDRIALLAAVLHDTLEDTETNPDELAALFGVEVREVVEEVSDDKSLPKEVRKELQVEHAPYLSDRAKLVKLGDKIANVTDVVNNPPSDWPLERRIDYLEWTRRVIAGCRGVNETLEQEFDRLLEAGLDQLNGPGGPPPPSE